MKKRKRQGALFVAALLAALALAGCREEAATAESLLAGVRKKLPEASSLEGSWTAAAQVRMPEADGAAGQEGELCLNGEVQVTDSGWTHLTADLKIVSAGQMQQGSAQLYLEEEADRRDCYLSLDGSWEYRELPAEAPAFQVWDRLLSQEAEWSLAENSQEVDGQEAYALTAEASLDTWGLALLGGTGAWSQVRELLAGAGLDPAAIPVELTCLISREESFPLKLEAGTASPFSVTQAEAFLSGAEVELSLTWSGISFNTVDSLAIPEEARAAETEPETPGAGFSSEGETASNANLEGEIQLEEEFLPGEPVQEPCC